MSKLVVYVAASTAIVAGFLAEARADDFASRCAAPGVVKCVGFDDTTTEIVRGQTLHPDGNGVYRGGLDTAVKASGNGSLRFDLPPPPHAGQNIAGSWTPLSNDALGRLFGQNSTFYVQFRQRFSPEMLSNTWNGYWKTVIFHYNQRSCGSLELATQRYYGNPMVTMYTDCGGRNFFTTLDGTRLTNSTPLLLQQGDYRCEYGRINASDCFFIATDEWMTFYYKITIGTWDQPNSTVEAWVAFESSSEYRQFVRVPDLSLSCNSNSCTTSPGRDEGFNNLTFTPYMTGLPSNSGRAGVTSRVWYDELIVSTQPIPPPTASARPQAPSSLRIQ